MKTKPGIVFTILLLFLAGCAGRLPTPIPIPNTPPTSTPQPTSVPSLTPTPTQPPTPTDTPQPTSAVVQHCLTIQPNLPDRNSYQGILAFDNHLGGVKNSVSFYNLQKGTWAVIPGRGNFDPVVSPNRKYFAYENYEAKQLQIFSSDGKQIKSIAWGKNWGSVISWLDNTHISILTSESDPNVPENPLAQKYPQTIVVIEPFTGQILTMLPEYPDIDQVSFGFSWGRSGTTIYHPDLKRVIYPGSIPSIAGMGYILYDIPEKKKLAQLSK
jgi:hypothetical protein